MNYSPDRTGEAGSTESVDHVICENTIEDTATIKKDKNLVTDNSLLEKKIQSTFDEALDFCEASQDFWQKGELENALDALDQAYDLILKVNPDDNPELLQQREDLRVTIAKRIIEVYKPLLFFWL